METLFAYLLTATGLVMIGLAAVCSDPACGYLLATTGGAAVVLGIRIAFTC